MSRFFPHIYNCLIICKLKQSYGFFIKKILFLQPIHRPSGLRPEACSGLTMSGAFRARLQRRGLAPSNGPNPFLRCYDKKMRLQVQFINGIALKTHFPELLLIK